jgi:hypothetical protein
MAHEEPIQPIETGGSEGRPFAVTLHRIPREKVCGVVVLVKQPDASWAGACSRCGQRFQMDADAKFEGQVRAIRN